MFQDTKDGQTHSYGDGCGEAAHNKPQNPPAFPMHDSMGLVYEGMSLRDWFAGQALQGIFADDNIKNIVLETAAKNNIKPSTALAKMSYDFADAMLKERAKKE